jgi:hypothetical protein
MECCPASLLARLTCGPVPCCAVPCSYPTFLLQDADEKVRARLELLQGKLGDMLTMMARLVVSKADLQSGITSRQSRMRLLQGYSCCSGGGKGGQPVGDIYPSMAVPGRHPGSWYICHNQ